MSALLQDHSWNGYLWTTQSQHYGLTIISIAQSLGDRAIANLILASAKLGRDLSVEQAREELSVILGNESED
mgnify:CR=1 FL=1